LKEPISRSEAKQKAAAYCAYQERAEVEVKRKLLRLGMPQPFIGEIIEELKRENFIDESRFAKSYARGKFNLKKWGRIKIRQGLHAKGISNEMVEAGWNEIDKAEYEECLRGLIAKKIDKAGSNDSLNRYQVARFLLQKGYEKDLVWNLLNELIK